jgi:integrase
MSRGNVTRRASTAGVSSSMWASMSAASGKRQDAEKELTRLPGQTDAGTLVEPSKVTVAEYMKGWLGPMPKAGEQAPEPPIGLTPKTAGRYRELAELYIYPHLGSIVLQKLKPAKVREWHETLLRSGGANGRALAATSVGHAHRVLHRALERAVETETLCGTLPR